MAHEEIRFVPASTVSSTLLWKAFVEGFQGYIVPVQIEEEPFNRMIAASLSISLRRSWPSIAQWRAARCMSACHSRWGWLVRRSRRCARDAAQGAWAGTHGPSIEEARSRGLERYLLECINGNDAASRLYLDLGFQVSGDSIFRWDPASVPHGRPKFAHLGDGSPNIGLVRLWHRITGCDDLDRICRRCG